MRLTLHRSIHHSSAASSASSRFGHAPGAGRRRRRCVGPRPCASTSVPDTTTSTWLDPGPTPCGWHPPPPGAGHPRPRPARHGRQQVIAGLARWCAAPITVRSARDGQGEKVSALDAGAVDLIIKPSGMDELLARPRRPQTPDRAVRSSAVRRPPTRPTSQEHHPDHRRDSPRRLGPPASATSNLADAESTTSPPPTGPGSTPLDNALENQQARPRVRIRSAVC